MNNIDMSVLVALEAAIIAATPEIVDTTCVYIHEIIKDGITIFEDVTLMSNEEIEALLADRRETHPYAEAAYGFEIRKNYAYELVSII